MKQLKIHAVDEEGVVSFFRMYPHALPAMKADRTALGSIPVQAYQYCEALCSASSFGWYAFPAADIQLWFDGTDIYVANGQEWQKLKSQHLPEVDRWWNSRCPVELVDKAPPFLTYLGIPGYVQIWSGLLVQTVEDWSVLVRPLANVQRSNQFFCFEGIVETDRYGPAPLFINIKLNATDTVIELGASDPLFQVQPVYRKSYERKTLNVFENREMCAGDYDDSAVMTEKHWEGYRKTIRAADPAADQHQTGSYAREARRRR